MINIFHKANSLCKSLTTGIESNDLTPSPQDWERAVNEWYVEVADMPNTFATSFRLLNNKKIGHYTQVRHSS